MIHLSPRLLTGEESIEKKTNNKQVLNISILNSLTQLIISYIHNHHLQNLIHLLFLTNDKHILFKLVFMIYSFLWGPGWTWKIHAPTNFETLLCPKSFKKKITQMWIFLASKETRRGIFSVDAYQMCPRDWTRILDHWNKLHPWATGIDGQPTSKLHSSWPTGIDGQPTSMDLLDILILQSLNIPTLTT